MGKFQLSATSVAIGFMLGAIFISTLATFKELRIKARWQVECIARGVAEYDAKTGEWKWTVEKEGNTSKGGDL